MNTDETPTCKVCGEQKSRSEFRSGELRSPAPTCGKCLRIKYYSRENMRAKNLRLRYGLTTEQHSQMIADRDGKCDICRIQRPLNVDHDHESGKIRGMLCGKCNKALGLLGDSVVNLQAAITYLEA